MVMKLRYIIFVMCCFCFVQQISSQNENVKELLKTVAESYESKMTYKIDATYNMHRGFKGDKITESYQGTMVKNGDFSRFKVDGSEIIHFSGVQLSIDHGAKKVIYNKNAKNESVQNSPIDLTGFLEFYDRTLITEKNGILKCEMVTSKPNPQNPYGKVVLHIEKHSNLVIKQELFFSNKVPFVDKESNSRVMDTARLVILLDYSDLVTNEKPILSDFITTSNKKVILTEQFKGYTVINQDN